jgi:hypothetical protein
VDAVPVSKQCGVPVAGGGTWRQCRCWWRGMWSSQENRGPTVRSLPYPVTTHTSAAMLVLYPTRYSDQAGRAPFSGEVLAGRTCMLGDLVPQPEDC